MSETSNIAKMAELLSSELFGEFLWKRSGPINENWACVVESHERSTHSSDVVFYYDEPYEPVRTYVTCDLKSYSAETISTAQIYGAVKSLALSLGCAEQSEEWRKKYLHDGVSASIVGLLFVYNHDGAYDRNFREMFRSVKFDDIPVPRGSRLFVIGPDEVQWLDNVHYEINHLRGRNVIPDPEHCRFFYPQLVQKKNLRIETARAATLEMLSGPWISLLCEDPQKREKTLLVFYRGRGSVAQEFLYLIDHLMHFQQIAPGINILIRTLDADSTADANFQRAVEEYIAEFGGTGEASSDLRRVEFAPINKVHTSFSTESIGMMRGQ
jgi:hypothetical protein